MLVRLVALTTALSLLLALATTLSPAGVSAAGSESAPTIAQTFTPASIVVKSISRLRLTITNTSEVALTGVSVEDPLPSGVGVSSVPNFATNCGGSATYATNSGITTVKLVNGNIAANGSCEVAINVIGLTAGTKTNVTSAVTSNEAQDSTTSSAVLTVTPGFVGGFVPPRTSYHPIPGFPMAVKFSVGGNQGLDVLEEAKSRQVDCRTREPLGDYEPANKFFGLFFYTPFIDAYTFLWATKPAWFGTCREFVLVLEGGVESTGYVAFTFDFGQFPQPEPD